MNTQDIVQKLWNLCHVLRDDGITYHEYVTELTFLLFLKMTKETGTEDQIPKGYRWEPRKPRSPPARKRTSVTVDLMPSKAGTVGDPDAHGFRDMSIGVQATVAIAAATLSVEDLGVNITGSKLNGVGYLTMVGEGSAWS